MSNNIRTESVQDAILFSPKTPQCHKHWLLRFCRSTSLAVYLISNLITQMYKLCLFALYQNSPSGVYKTQNIEGNSRWPEIPFRSLGGVNLLYQWIEFLKIFWINSLRRRVMVSNCTVGYFSSKSLIAMLKTWTPYHHCISNMYAFLNT